MNCMLELNNWLNNMRFEDPGQLLKLRSSVNNRNLFFTCLGCIAPNPKLSTLLGGPRTQQLGKVTFCLTVGVAHIMAAYCRPLINKALPFKGLNMRIPFIFPNKGREFKNQGSGLQWFYRGEFALAFLIDP